MAANPFGAHQVGVHKPTAWPGDMRQAMMSLGVPVTQVIRIVPPARPTRGGLGRQRRAPLTATPVCAENSDSSILMMQPADHDLRNDASNPLNGATGRCILVQ